MDRENLRRLLSADSERILNALLEHQHLHPHRALGQVLLEVGRKIGYCTEVAERSMQWLELDEKRSVGRLRRTELSQLARSLHRMWRLTLTPAR